MCKTCIQKKRQDLLKDYEWWWRERGVKEDSRAWGQAAGGIKLSASEVGKTGGEQAGDQKLCLGHIQSQVLTNYSRGAIYSCPSIKEVAIKSGNITSNQ